MILKSVAISKTHSELYGFFMLKKCVMMNVQDLSDMWYAL